MALGQLGYQRWRGCNQAGTVRGIDFCLPRREMEKQAKLTRRVRGSWPEIEEEARQNRRALTLAEERLWAALKGKRLAGLRFRCQHPVGRFIFDFYCPSRKLVVEVDGAVHDTAEQAEHDVARTDEISSYGYRVVRVRNDEIFAHLPAVLDRIASAAQHADAHHPRNED